jgi:hypothetical protein
MEKSAGRATLEEDRDVAEPPIGALPLETRYGNRGYILGWVVWVGFGRWLKAGNRFKEE